MDTKLQVLRAKIKELQSAGEALRRRIQKSSGLKRHSLWQQKRALGEYSRYHLVAYGLLRGIPYDRIEKCSENNRPNPKRLFELMKAHAPWQLDRDLTIDRVKVLLGITPPVSTVLLPEPPKSLLDRARALLVSAGAK